MAGYSVLASRYAHSLFSLAQEKGLTNEVEADLIGIKNAFHESADLRSFLKSPVININTKNIPFKQNVLMASPNQSASYSRSSSHAQVVHVTF